MCKHPKPTVRRFSDSLGYVVDKHANTISLVVFDAKGNVDNALTFNSSEFALLLYEISKEFM